MAVAGYDPVLLATLVVTAVTVVVGLYIAYQAYRGLRRHDSAPMRYLSVGMFLLFGVTYVVGVTGTQLLRLGVVSLRYQSAFRLVVRLLQLGGLAAIAYSLYLVRHAEPTLHPTADGGRDGTGVSRRPAGGDDSAAPLADDPSGGDGTTDSARADE